MLSVVQCKRVLHVYVCMHVPCVVLSNCSPGLITELSLAHLIYFRTQSSALCRYSVNTYYMEKWTSDVRMHLSEFFFLSGRVLFPCLYMSVSLSSCPLSLHLFLFFFYSICCLLFHFSPCNLILDTFTYTPPLFLKLFS